MTFGIHPKQTVETSSIEKNGLCRSFDLITFLEGKHFTDCLVELMHKEGILGLNVDGQRFDIGNSESYLRALVEYREARTKKASRAKDFTF